MAKDDEKLDKLDRIISLLEDISSSAGSGVGGGSAGAAASGASGKAAAAAGGFQFGGLAGDLAGAAGAISGSLGSIGGAGLALVGGIGQAINTANRVSQFTGISAFNRARRLGASEAGAFGAQQRTLASNFAGVPFGDVAFARSQQRFSAETTAVSRTQSTLEALARVNGSVSDSNVRTLLEQNRRIADRETSIRQRVQNIADESIPTDVTGTFAGELAGAAIAVQKFAEKVVEAADSVTFLQLGPALFGTR